MPSEKFDDKNRISDAELPQVPESEKRVGFLRGLFRKLYSRPSSEKINYETLNEAELVAKITDLREKRDELNQKLDKLWPVLSRSEDSAPAITREMKNASEKAEDAKFDLDKAYEELRKINPDNPILPTQKRR